MADPRFFEKTPALTLGDLAGRVGGTVSPDTARNILIQDVAPLDIAGAGHLSFLDNVKYKEAFAQTKASACIVAPKMAEFAPPGVVLLLSETPYKLYARAAQIFYPDEFPAASVHATAIIDPTADIGAGCRIEPGVVIGAGAKIGAGTWIEAHAVIGSGVVIGQKCRIGAQVTVSHALIGDQVRLYPGVRVGQDGFGFAIDPAGHVKVPQLGRVIIEDHVEIGSNTCIDRGAGPDTVIGAGSWIDNLVQIGHNVKIGRGCILIAQSGVAGSTVLGDYAVLAAQAGVAGHIRVGQGAQIGAQSGVMRDVPPGETHLGSPAMPSREYWRQVTALKRLTNRQKDE